MTPTHRVILEVYAPDSDPLKLAQWLAFAIEENPMERLSTVRVECERADWLTNKD